MKKFKVGFSYEESGQCVVEAETIEEAEHILVSRLAAEGVADLKFDCMNRDYGTHGGDEIDCQVRADIEHGEFVPEEEIV